MQATCALCLRPVVAPDRWLISGTEVFHMACVKALGTMGSVANRMKIDLGRLAAEIDRLKGEVELAKQQTDLERLTSRQAAAERTVLYNELQAVKDREWRVQHDEQGLRQRLEQARRERDDAIPATPEVAKDDRDATEIRYSLLELDLP